ncbi:MAG: hypothetical protein COA32_13950 [Fluviicola sp.]|nr:MAG: hypothetical protein COA32_13950 [Fluviicola sp.]
MNKLYSFLVVILVGATCTFGQEVELAAQKGHSSAIEQIEFSENGEHLLSWGTNNEGIIWDLNLRKALTRFKLPENIEVSGIKFTKEDQFVKIQSEENTYYFELSSDELTTTSNDGDTLFRKKGVFFDPDGLHKTYLKKGSVKKEKKDKLFARYWISVNYTNAEFYSFDVSIENNLIVGVAENNAIYCNTYIKGKKLDILQGHNSSAMDIRFSPDGKYFATAGKDRSIIIWDSQTLKMKFRLFSNIFRKNTAVFSHDGNQIHVGDELGNLYTINFDAVFPTTDVGSNPQSINKIIKSEYKEESTYFICNSDNSMQVKKNLHTTEPIKSIKFRQHELTQSKGLLLQNMFGLYQEPIGEVKTCDISKDGKSVLLTGKTDIPNITLAQLDNNKTKHFYAYEDHRNWVDAKFLSKDAFISVLDSSGILYLWRRQKKDYYFKKDSLPFIINQIAVLDTNTLWITSSEQGQYLYQISKKKYQKVLDINSNSLFMVKGKIVLSDVSHQLLFINPHTFEIEATFNGHTERITDINFHPEKDVFISSSDDGTVRLWDHSKEELVASIIPFKNNEVMIFTSDNHYLISKGAIDEIGFRYKGQFFYPDQFDLKFNRPDLVLEKLGYTNNELIKAYHRAYEKRLKKLNFTEEALSGDFHLPELEVLNKTEIPVETETKDLELTLHMVDTKDKLESYKIWINDVAVLGSTGKSIRSLNTSELTRSVPLTLSYGSNKIEISVLNQSGAESYKEVINVICKEGKKKPDAYIISIGVSKYKEEQYNLAYAAKDAKDIQQLFGTSEYFGKVHTKSITNVEVILECLNEISAFLDQADVDDFVLIFVAGHGVLDENFDYYFASYDMDFNNPSDRGIPYKKIEELVDGIKALKKLLILDTCHSGELDKDEVEKRENITNDSPEKWKFRNAGIAVAFREDPLGFDNINYLMKQVFLDLRRGTGATVISSSGGTELAFESPKYKNGLFTYSLIDALQSNKADTNKDKVITVSELQLYLTEEVKKLSNGLQIPTSRIHNKEMDYRVW